MNGEETSGLRIAHLATMREQVVSGPRNSVTLLSYYLNQIPGVESQVFTSYPVEKFYFNDELVLPLVDAVALKRFDCVIFSSFFNFDHVKIARLLTSWGIPYVIAPRSSFMKRSYTRSSLKKAAFMTLGGMRYIREARSVQFLTDDEQHNSFMWNRDHFVCGNIVRNRVLAQSAKLAPENKLIGFMGRLDVVHKGLDLLLEAIARSATDLRKQGVSFVFAGPDYRGGRASLTRLIGKYRLSDLVQLRDSVSGQEKTHFLAGLSAFIHTSRYEGQPQSVMEAMAQGLPIIASCGSNMQSIVRQADCGICLGTDEQFAEGLKAFARQVDQLPRWSRAAKAYAEQHFDGANVAQTFLGHIQQRVSQSN